MKTQMKTQSCILCGKKYTPRCEKSYFCLDCYLNDYLPNKHKYSVSDFESGCYSLITKRHYEEFWGKRLSESNSDIRNKTNQEASTKLELENNSKIENDVFHIKCTKSVNPEQAHKRLVDAICSKITYI